ncbi:MAG TPA: transglutaminase-like domain-containing protein [Longimicrobiales bacterium]|nr:transglutaminase-like domain-containing protein [Longimicrobiales bacterium]
MRRWRGAAVILAWIGVLGMHVRREYFKGELLRLEEGARSLAPGAMFYTIRMNGRAIGLSSSRLDTVPGGFEFEDMTRLDVPALGQSNRAIARSRVALDASLSVREFDFELDSEVGRFTVHGVATGDSVLEVRVGAGGDAQVSRIELDEPLVVPAALPMRLAASGRMAAGREFRARLFDPSVLAQRELVIRVIERDTLIVPDSAALDENNIWQPAGYDTVPVWRIEEAVGEIATTTWVDDDGRMIRSESPLGFMIERTEYELASQAWRIEASRPADQGYGGLIESTAIASDADLASSDYLSQLRVRVLGVDLEGFDLAGGRQTLRGDTLVITTEAAEAFRAKYRLPYTGDGEPASELGATPLIQSNDPRIVAQAREIAGSERDPAAVARLLNAWVYASLEKDITLSVPSALQVLEARQGDCNEHTVLYVALARALGLPARTAVGLVSVNGRFYYHAWPEVWLDGWVAVDPTLGQYPADATHLRFLIGDLVRQLELVRLIGRLELDVVEDRGEVR